MFTFVLYVMTTTTSPSSPPPLLPPSPYPPPPIAPVSTNNYRLSDTGQNCTSVCSQINEECTTPPELTKSEIEEIAAEFGINCTGYLNGARINPSIVGSDCFYGRDDYFGYSYSGTFQEYYGCSNSPTNRRLICKCTTENKDDDGLSRATIAGVIIAVTAASLALLLYVYFNWINKSFLLTPPPPAPVPTPTPAPVLATAQIEAA